MPATLNPIAMVGDVFSSPHHGAGLQTVVFRITGGGAHTVEFETACEQVLQAICINETDGALVATTIAASSLNPGTQKVSFVVANTKTYSLQVTSLLNRTANVQTTGGNTSVRWNPINRA